MTHATCEMLDVVMSRSQHTIDLQETPVQFSFIFVCVALRANAP